MATVSGVFKFQNSGDAILNVEPPKASCCWPVTELKADILPPGTAGELSFTSNLGFSRATLEKQIAVRSYDPLTPEVSLTCGWQKCHRASKSLIKANPDRLITGSRDRIESSRPDEVFFSIGNRRSARNLVGSEGMVLVGHARD